MRMLDQTITEIKEEEEWEKDPDFKEAVEDDLAVIIRMSAEMKEKVLWLFSLKYQPETEKL